MRPVPVPEWARSLPWVEGTAVYAAPDGDLTSTQIPPAEGLLYISQVEGYADPIPMVGVVLRLDDADAEAICAGERHILMSWPGRQMPVFMVPEVLVEQPPASHGGAP